MKKRLSAAGLGIRLTWLAVVFFIVVTCALQAWLFWRQEPVWGGVEFDFGYSIALEHVIENDGISTVGKFGAVALIYALAACVGSAQTGMTLRRLRIREWEVTLWWSLMFAGYFLLFWAAQLGMLLWMFQLYAEVSGWGPIDLFISSFSSPYFHLVLPLSEPWAVARNIFLCLSWGTVAALTALEGRHGGKPVMLFVFVILTRMFLPSDMASQVSDMAAIAVLGCLLASYIWTIHGRLRDED